MHFRHTAKDLLMYKILFRSLFQSLRIVFSKAYCIFPDSSTKFLFHALIAKTNLLLIQTQRTWPFVLVLMINAYYCVVFPSFSVLLRVFTGFEKHIIKQQVQQPFFPLNEQCHKCQSIDQRNKLIQRLPVYVEYCFYDFFLREDIFYDLQSLE